MKGRFKMNKQVELMNQYVADLAVLNVKFHNLHWNVVGPRFKPTHEYLEALYDDFFEKYDEVAERIKMLGAYPVASLKGYLELTSIKELSDEEVTDTASLEIAKASLLALKDLALRIRDEADQNDDFVTVAMTEDHIAGFDKEIWFIESTLK
jgi:starvation-inducible DNA-binding protein